MFSVQVRTQADPGSLQPQSQRQDVGHHHRRRASDGDGNPSNNLAHCFSCGKNFNSIDLMLIQGHDFLLAVGILENWLMQYRRDLGRRTPSEQTASERTASEQSAAK